MTDLKSKVATFPKKPGVYLMKDFDGNYIYIGKAKDLRARVRTYFAKGDGRIQIQYLLKKVKQVEYILTTHEEEALVLERELIHRHKPRYNIRLKDDKAYLSIKIDRNHPFPRLETVRQIIPDGAEYFGPFPATIQLRDVLEVIKRIVPLRTCSNNVFSNRARPCLEYEIKRCAGPCCLKVDQSQYSDWLKQAIDIIEGKVEKVLVNLEREMNFASEDLRFEEAAALRDRINTLNEFKNRGRDQVSYSGMLDIFSMYRENDLCVVSILKTRDGRMSEVESYDFREVLIPDGELLQAVVQQYYESGREVPSEIILIKEIPELEMVQKFFKESFDLSPIIEVPIHGPKHRLVRICEINARQAFQQKFFTEARYEAIADSLVQRFSLRQTPRRIECVDISNFQGSDIVGAIVSFQDGVPDRKRYRRYNISFNGEPNDFQAIYEVVSRRLAKKENLPDLLIIDGGSQQLARAIQARDELEITLDIISIAKIKVEKRPGVSEISHKPERIFIEGESTATPLDAADTATHFLQRIRDEVHRYAITFHRQKRKARVFNSILDDIAGVGPDRKNRLLSVFGSIDGIKSANVSDIAKAGRMTQSLAQKILNVLTTE